MVMAPLILLLLLLLLRLPLTSSSKDIDHGVSITPSKYGNTKTQKGIYDICLVHVLQYAQISLYFFTPHETRP
jgi:hypothetical protein